MKVVTILGRPNVGKSTLFNRLIGARQAIVDDTPGLTRDRIYGEVKWKDKKFSLIDTGGLVQNPKETIEKAVFKQAQIAIDESDLILFVLDAKSGLIPLDHEVAAIIRKVNKKVIVVANKIDDYNKHQQRIWDLYELGFDDVIAISAEHALGIGDLLDAIVENFPFEASEKEQQTLNLAVIGRPNVGKSSLVNAILGEDRSIVTDIPGTTRDAIDSYFSFQGADFKIIDTAGLRRRGQLGRGIEKYSAIRTEESVERAEVVLVVLDCISGLVEQDKKVAGIAHNKGRGVVIVVNKWDQATINKKKFGENIYLQMPFLDYAPLAFTSALEKTGIEALLETTKIVEGEWQKRIQTGVLNELIQDAMAISPPPSKKGKRLKLFYVTQANVGPPTFIFFVNNPDLIHFSYARFWENQIRKAFGFVGSPLRFKYIKRGE